MKLRIWADLLRVENFAEKSLSHLIIRNISLLLKSTNQIHHYENNPLLRANFGIFVFI